MMHFIVSSFNTNLAPVAGTVAGLIFFCIGFIAGSFLNVVGFRYDGTRSVFNIARLGGRSHCPHCNTQLRWYELIPLISYLVQSGRCRTCGKRISLQYPIVELLTGIAFVLPLYFFGPLYSFPVEHAFSEYIHHAWLAVAVLMILIAIVDTRLMIIPDELVALLAVIGLGFGVIDSGSFLGSYTALVSSFANPFINHLAGGIAAAVLLGIIVLLSRGRAMGMGDVKLAGAMGLLLGFPDIVLALAISFVVGGLWSIILLLMHRTGFKKMVPFGPFLIIGFWLHIFFGEALLSWYFSLL